MSLKILVTGASGFVGGKILSYLLEQESNVTVVARKNSVFTPKVRDQINSFICTNNLFKENSSWFLKTLEGFDIVIHAAWFAKPGKYLDSKLNKDCLDGTLKLGRAAKKIGVKRFIGIGTCAEYDLNYGLLSVETPLKPVSAYARSKAKAYAALSEEFLNSSTQFAWCRLFYLYGDNEDKQRLVPYIREKLILDQEVHISNGHFTRDYLDVEIAGACIAEIALSSETGPINVCSGLPITIKELALKISQEYDRSNLLRFNNSINSTDPVYVVGVPNWNMKEKHEEQRY